MNAAAPLFARRYEEPGQPFALSALARSLQHTLEAPPPPRQATVLLLGNGLGPQVRRLARPR